MRRTVVRYKTKPERSDENERLIKAVFDELAARAPAGLRYLVLRLADGGFVHVVMVDGEAGGNPLAGLPAFQAFQGGIRDRCAEPPQAAEATIVGDYRMLGT